MVKEIYNTLKDNTSMENLLDKLRKFLQEECDGISDFIDFIFKHNIHRWPLDKEFNIEEYHRLISTIAMERPAFALAISMHIYTVIGILESIDKERLGNFIEVFKNKDILVSSINEPGLYFVNSKQINPEEYPIKAKKHKNNYYVSGVKRYVSLEPFVNYLPIYCLVIEDDEVKGIAIFMIDKNRPGIKCTTSWESISMKETFSNDIYFDNVYISEKDVLLYEFENMSNTNVLGVLFRYFISSVYFGIAEKAVDYVCNLCHSRKVPHTNKKLANFPGVQSTLAEMIIKLEIMKSQFLSFSINFDYKINTDIDTKSLVLKEVVASNAKDIVTMGMKIEGISSIREKSVLANLYNDVIASQFHPPQKDILYELISKRALGIISTKKRWL